MTNPQDNLSRHGESEDSKLQLLRRDFENLSMEESDNIDSFFTRDWIGHTDEDSWRSS